MDIAENAENVLVAGASATQFLLRKCCAKKCRFTSRKMWCSQERGNKFAVWTTIYGLNMLARPALNVLSGRKVPRDIVQITSNACDLGHFYVLWAGGNAPCLSSSTWSHLIPNESRLKHAKKGILFSIRRLYCWHVIRRAKYHVNNLFFQVLDAAFNHFSRRAFARTRSACTAQGWWWGKSAF